MALVCAACAGGGGKSGGSQTAVAASRYAPAAPVRYGYKVVNTYPHNTSSYTQGLLWHNGYLYESTGLAGRSTIQKVELQTGRILQRHDLGGEYFGEGLALHGDKFYQLTWQSGRAFVYNLDFTPAGEFSYKGEGWGLTSDGTHLYMSDGTDCIYVLDPATFRRLRTIQVVTDRQTVLYLNELEWIDGQIWANVYTSNLIVRIDPATGHVAGMIDLTVILPAEAVTPETDVLNGIAWDGRRVFVTGKNWSKLFEIELTEK